MTLIKLKQVWKVLKRRLWNFLPSSVRRLVKWCLAAFLLYFIGKVPVMWLLTDIFHVHYIFSGAVAGAAITLLQFVPSEWWIWRKK